MEYTKVIETHMSDGIDRMWEWKNVKQALKSGRFDYLIENGEYEEEDLTKCKNVVDLIDLVGFPFYIK